MNRFGSIAAHPNPLLTPTGSTVGATVLRWESTGTEMVEVRVGAPDGPLFSSGGPNGTATTGEWVSDGMTFFLQDVSQGAPLTAEHTLATVQVRVKAEAPSGLILMYHRVAEISPDPWDLAVTPRRFAEQMAALRELARPCKLRQLARALQDGDEIEEASVAVTFDDGYADNLHQAKPWLERYEIPATVFVTAGYIGSGRDFWWDALDCLLVADRLPATLRLTIGGEDYEWSLPENGEAPQQEWRAWRDVASQPRQKLYCELHRLLKPLAEEERLDVMDQILCWAGVDQGARADNRQLTIEELRELARDGLVEIGSHTMTHSDLQSLPPQTQRDEITRSKIALAEMLERPIMSFAYPYGSLLPETPAIVQAAGYECACLASGGGVTRKSDSFQMPRVMVEDWDGEEFARRLRDWLQ